MLDIEGVNGTNITLSLPLLWLAEQEALGRLICTGTTGNFILGFPIFQYYYLAYDMESNTITFVDLPQSDETKAFIDGTELGGTNESSSGPDVSAQGDTAGNDKETKAKEETSSGYHYHEYTTRSLMAAIGFLLLAFRCNS